MDAFAGTGARVPSGKRQEAAEPGLFEDVYDDHETVEYQDGSARIALSLAEPFDHYLFVDKARTHIDELQQMIGQDYPQLAPRCVFQ